MQNEILWITILQGSNFSFYFNYLFLNAPYMDLTTVQRYSAACANALRCM